MLQPKFMSAFAFCGALLACSAHAQSFIPIDSRPATSRLPAQIAALQAGAELSASGLKVVPPELLGTARQGANAEALWQWLEAEGAGSADEPLIVALDALAYGGLVQSRSSDASVARVLSRLLPLREWQARTGRPIYAFMTIPRHPDAQHRQRNFEVLKLMTLWAAEGVFEQLDIAWDDALPGSPAPAEGRQLAQFAAEKAPNVRVYPGADEVASLLVARALASEQQAQPRALVVEYSDPKAAQQVIKYEGIPLTQSVQNHAEAAGFEVLGTGEAAEGARPDLTLYVYNGGGDPRQAALRISALLRKGPVSVVDVDKVNRGNPALWRDLGTLRRDANLVSLAAWGTPGNNLGSALAHARVFLAHTDLGGVAARRQQALLAREYANDLIYSTYLRGELRGAVPENEMNTPEAQQRLLELAEPYFPLELGGRYTLDRAALPWGRSFEWDFDLAELDGGGGDEAGGSE